MISLVLMIVALILFILAAMGVSGGRINLMAAGLACWTLAQVIPFVG
jgi:hypothetical protein